MQDLTTNGWIWIAASALVLLAELLLPGWAFVSIALAMATTGITLLLGLWAPSFVIALLVTGLLSGVIWCVLWSCFPKSRGRSRVWDTDINDPPSTLR